MVASFRGVSHWFIELIGRDDPRSDPARRDNGELAELLWLGFRAAVGSATWMDAVALLRALD